jgi:AcrR family transcriptional regulator
MGQGAAYATREDKVTHNAPSTDDRRVLRTHKALYEALISLTVRKGFAAVTVSDLTEAAGVNRATFYRHFQDKFDLLDHYANEVYRLLDASAQPVLRGASDPPEAPEDGLVRMFEHIRGYAPFYRVMLGRKGDPGFAGIMQSFIQMRIAQAVPEALRERPVTQLVLSYIASGSVGVARWWLEHDMSLTSAELAAMSIRLTTASIGALAPRQR